MAITFHNTNPQAIEADSQLFSNLLSAGISSICSVEPYPHGLLGVIVDPQHHPNLTKFPEELREEVESGRMSATKLVYKAPLVPPWDSAVLIGKADLDALAASALILWYHTLRHDLCGEFDIPENDDGGLAHRVELINSSDCGLWAREWEPDRKHLSEEEFLAKCAEDPLLPMHSYVRQRTTDQVELLKLVKGVLLWLLTGEEPEGFRQKATADRLAAFKASELIEIIGEGDRAIAVVKSYHFGATGFAYGFAPYCVCFNPEFRGSKGDLDPHLKYTVGRFNDKFPWDGAKFVELANEAERNSCGCANPSWGGPPNVKGSTPGRDSMLAYEQVVEIFQSTI